MISPRVLDQAFWALLADRLDEGIVVFDQEGTVIYANEEAARLLDYAPIDVQGLDVDDFLSLCQPDRLDAPSFAHDLQGRHLPSRPARRYRVVTAARRLEIAPFAADRGPRLMVLLLREAVAWQDELIARTTLEEMNSPLVFASSYCDTLIKQVRQGWGHRFELEDLARIVQESVGRALQLWERASRLRKTAGASQGQRRPVVLPIAIQIALSELEGRGVQGLRNLRLNLPDDLPPVAAVEQHLHAALCALLESAAARLSYQGHMAVSARSRGTYIQLDLTPHTAASALQGYLFDELPLAICEQVIVQMGGRIWFTTQPEQPPTCSISLPVWTDPLA